MLGVNIELCSFPGEMFCKQAFFLSGVNINGSLDMTIQLGVLIEILRFVLLSWGDVQQGGLSS